MVDNDSALRFQWSAFGRQCSIVVTESDIELQGPTGAVSTCQLSDIEIVRLVHYGIRNVALHFAGDRGILRARFVGPMERANWIRHKLLHWLHQRARFAQAAGPFR